MTTESSVTTGAEYILFEIENSCEISLNMSLSSLNACFRLLIICTRGKCYFSAIPSDNVEIDISCEIFLNKSLSSQNARFRLLMICTRVNCYFDAIPSHKVEI